jgi:hypothetical protein
MTATIKPPDRSRKQRTAALAAANEVRHERAVLKRDIKTGRQKLTPLLLEPPSYLETAKILDWLLVVPYIGIGKAGTILNRSRVSLSKTFGGATLRQRREIVQELELRMRYRPRR